MTLSTDAQLCRSELTLKDVIDMGYRYRQFGEYFISCNKVVIGLRSKY